MKLASSFHANDFDWNDLAAKCRAQLEEKDQTVVSVSEDELGTLAQSNWDVFHAKNNGKVYKPRNYLSKEFPELRSANTVLEVGCGYGSAIFPLLAECPSMFAHVCDFSPHAIDILKANPLYDATRCNAYVCDLVLDDTVGLPENSVDVVLMVFVLSAIPPTSFANVIEKISRALKPGGLVCFRDYGLYDLAMMRSTKKVSSATHSYDSLYYRSGDNTLAYYFSTEDLAKLFERFDIIDNSYCTVRLRNRRTQTDMDRVWIHGKFVKR
ncbi:Methyltransferase-like protein 6 [Aphanomyces cochlioides]|nr:Methyltransferase-like protein 6 [Aphanomyces cochlioides]